MPHKYKPIFDNVNESRKKRGLKAMTWAEFLGKDSKDEFRRTRRIQDFVPPDPEKPKIERPPAVYSNKSIYDKYGV